VLAGVLANRAQAAEGRPGGGYLAGRVATGLGGV